MFPRLVLIVMGVLCVIGLARSLISPKGMTEQGTITIPLGSMIGVVLFLIGFALVLLLLGTECAVFGSVAGCLWLRTRKPLLAVASGIASVLIVYLVFVQALSVHLPLLFLPRFLFLGL